MRDTRYADADLPFIVQRAREGDPQAFESLAAAYRDRIYRWALVRTGDEDDAEDAAQEALVRLHRGLRKYSGRSGFESWLYAVVRSAAEDVRRSAERASRLKTRLREHRAPATAVGAPDAEDRMEARRMRDRLLVFLRDLPPRQREAMDLVDFQGVGHAEAANRMQIGDVTLRTHLFRARRALRARLLLEEGWGSGADE